MKPMRRFRVQLQQGAARFVLSILFARAARLHHRNSDTRAQFAHGVGKIDMLVIHNEPKNASARAAAKTMKRLPARTHHERRRFLLMERAKRLEICPRASQRE